MFVLLGTKKRKNIIIKDWGTGGLWARLKGTPRTVWTCRPCQENTRYLHPLGAGALISIPIPAHRLQGCCAPCRALLLPLPWQKISRNGNLLFPGIFSNCVVNSSAYFLFFFVIKLSKMNLISGHAINTKCALYWFQSYKIIYQFFSRHEMSFKVYRLLLTSLQLYQGQICDLEWKLQRAVFSSSQSSNEKQMWLLQVMLLTQGIVTVGTGAKIQS